MPMIWLNNWGWDMIMTHVTEHQKKEEKGGGEGIMRKSPVVAKFLFLLFPDTF